MTIGSGQLYIGKDPAERCEYLNGMLDEVRIHNRVLSAAEIRALQYGRNSDDAFYTVSFSANADGVKGDMFIQTFDIDPESVEVM